MMEYRLRSVLFVILLFLLGLITKSFGDSTECRLQFWNNVHVNCSHSTDGVISIQVKPMDLTNELVLGPSSDDFYVNIVLSNDFPQQCIQLPNQSQNQIQNLDQEYYVDTLIGIAIDGVPMYSSLDITGKDVFGDGLEGADLKIDQCGGSYGPTPNGIRYHYRVMPACIASRIRSLERRARYIYKIDDLLNYFMDVYEPVLIGYSLVGIPLYSPYIINGNNDKKDISQSYSDVDKCNGKEIHGKYAYVASPSFPYLMGCDPSSTNQSCYVYTDEFTHGNSFDCPNGYYSNDLTENICMPCPAGRYSACSALVNCSACSSETLFGYYAPIGSSVQIKCPGGRYGSSVGLTSELCSGPCDPGYICPAGSRISNPITCGNASVYCPIGSFQSQQVDFGYYSLPENVDISIRYDQSVCLKGSYCVHGIRKPCPIGTYGNTTSLTTSLCTDECPIGHYCPVGTVQPIPCPAGRYGNSSRLYTSECTDYCEPGYWCGLGSSSSKQNACKAGRYGYEFGLTNENCSTVCLYTYIELTGIIDISYCDINYCEQGFYCPKGSSRSNQFACGNASVYCPKGSGRPISVLDGFYSIGSSSQSGDMQVIDDEMTRYAQVECEIGYYCTKGVRYACPSGRYGSISKLSHPNCSGECHAGYYCPQASTSPTFMHCGVNASMYCPSGTSEPKIVMEGYYTIGDSLTKRYESIACPPGSYCQGDGLKWFCPPGRYSINGSVHASCDGPCDPGYYCPEGSSLGNQIPCPAGRYSSGGQGSDQCSGECKEGYYCPLNSSSSMQYECGNDYVYCPKGSQQPIPVDVHHYSTGIGKSTRSGQRECEFSDVIGTPPAAKYRTNICPYNTVFP